MIYRTTDWGANTFVRAHVEMLAHDWGAPIPGGSEASEQRRHPQRRHVTLRQHHHFHVPLHAAHR